MTRTNEPRTFTRPLPRILSEPQARVLEVLQLPSASYGLHTPMLAQAAGYSTTTVVTALRALVEDGLVKQSPWRSSRGYSWTAVSDQEAEQRDQGERTVEGLESALEALLGTSDGVQVSRLVDGGVSIRMRRGQAAALLATLQHAVADA